MIASCSRAAEIFVGLENRGRDAGRISNQECATGAISSSNRARPRSG
jgi:hypothetical protein